MKKILFTLMLLVSSMTLFSQNNQTAVTFDTAGLSPQAKAEITSKMELDATKAKVKAVGEWAGMGKEIGEAVNGSLEAITGNVDKIGETRVGKFTMIMVAYHILGKDLIGFTVIPIIMLFLFFIFIWLVNKFCLPKRFLLKEELKDANKQVIQPAEYEVVTPDGASDSKVGLVILFVVLEMALVWVMFS